MSKAMTIKVANCDLENTSRIESLKERIFLIRGHRVMLDSDLAKLYGVSTKRLNEQLKRNHARFPKDFAFQLTFAEAAELLRSRSQIVTLNRGQNIKHRPHVLTEHGAIMLASVLNSATAVKASVFVVRAFVQMRTILLEYAHLARRIDALEDNFNGNFRMVFDAIRQLIAAPASGRSIGFIQPPGATRKKAKP